MRLFKISVWNSRCWVLVACSGEAYNNKQTRNYSLNNQNNNIKIMQKRGRLSAIMVGVGDVIRVGVAVRVIGE